MLATISPDLLPLLAERLKALGDPTRLALMAALSESELTIGELATLVGTSQPNASRHIDRLEAAGWVSRRREGTRTLVRMADGVGQELCKCVCEVVRRQAEELARRAGGTT